MDYRTSAFQEHRPKLYGIAYRMLRMKADAEDALQDAFLRWYETDVERVRNPEAWLTTTVAHVCIDRLRAQRAKREEYIGPWLPEPLIGNEPALPEHSSGSSDLSMAFLIMLERLAPTEQAAFLLHDVFDYDYPEISSALDKSQASVRQMVHRARQRVRRERRFPVSEEAHRRLLERFLAAFRTADRRTLLELLSNEATWTADGGGKTAAVREIVHGAESIATLLAGVGRRLEAYGDRVSFHFVPINGEMGIMSFLAGKPMLAMSLVTDGRQVSAGFVVVNPDKLARVRVDLSQRNDLHVTEVSPRSS